MRQPNRSSRTRFDRQPLDIVSATCARLGFFQNAETRWGWFREESTKVRHPHPTGWSLVACSRLDSFPSCAAAKWMLTSVYRENAVWSACVRFTAHVPELDRLAPETFPPTRPFLYSTRLRFDKPFGMYNYK